MNRVREVVQCRVGELFKELGMQDEDIKKYENLINCIYSDISKLDEEIIKNKYKDKYINIRTATDEILKIPLSKYPEYSSIIREFIVDAIVDNGQNDSLIENIIVDNPEYKFTMKGDKMYQYIHPTVGKWLMEREDKGVDRVLPIIWDTLNMKRAYKCKGRNKEVIKEYILHGTRIDLKKDFCTKIEEQSKNFVINFINEDIMGRERVKVIERVKGNGGEKMNKLKDRCSKERISLTDLVYRMEYDKKSLEEAIELGRADRDNYGIVYEYDMYTLTIRGQSLIVSGEDYIFANTVRNLIERGEV